MDEEHGTIRVVYLLVNVAYAMQDRQATDRSHVYQFLEITAKDDTPESIGTRVTI
jgi:hypothetical protein